MPGKRQYREFDIDGVVFKAPCVWIEETQSWGFSEDDAKEVFDAFENALREKEREGNNR